MRTSTRCSRGGPQWRKLMAGNLKLLLLMMLSTVSFVTWSQSVSVDFKQGSNKNNTLGNIVWINSILQKTNSRIAEGMSTLQRLEIYGITASSSAHTVQFKILKHKDIYHAYDFITSWGQALKFTDQILPTGIIYPSYSGGSYYTAPLNTCGDLQTGGQAPTETDICNSLHENSTSSNTKDVLFPLMSSSPSSTQVEANYDPSSGSDSKTVSQVIGAYETQFGQRSVRLISNADITGTPTISVNNSDVDYTQYTLTYTSPGSTQIMIEFAAHVAAGSDPLGLGIGYGTGRGAHNISGGPYHVKYSGFDANGGDMDNQLQGSEIFLVPNCTLPAISPKCVGSGSFTYDATAGITNVDANTVYTWTVTPVVSGGPTITGTTGSVTINAGTTAGTYTINLHLANGEFTHDCSTTLTVVALPTVTADNKSVCTGNSVALTGSPAGGTWSGDHVTGSTFDASGVAAGTYVVTYTFTNSNSCSASATANVTVNALPTVTADNKQVCTGNSVALTGSPAGGTWSGDHVTGSTFDASGVAAGTYVVTYTFTNSNSCSASATANVTVNALPTVTADNKSVCTGNSVALTGSPAGGTWSGDHVTGSTFDASGVAAGTYVVTYTFTNSNSCSASATANVTVNALPTVTADNKSVCTGNTVALTGSPAGGTWSGDHVTGSTFDASGVAAGTYVVTYTFTNSNSCSASATANVTVNALPTVTADNKSVCTGNTVALTGSPAGGTWSGDHVTGSTFDASGVAAGTYVVTYTFTNSNSCSASATANVTVNALPTVTADNKSVCTGNTVALTGSPAGGTWSGDHVTGSTFDASGVAAGTYVVTYTFTNSNSCSASATANVTVNALPTVTADNKQVCIGNTVALTGSPAGGTWSGDHVTGSTFDASGVAAGTYVVTYTFTNSNSCSASATANVTVNALPTVTADNKSVCTGNTVALTGSPAGGTWSGDHVTGSTFDASGVAAGTYVVTYSYTNGSSCSGTATANVTVNALPTVTADNKSVCTGNTVALTGSPAGGTWSGDHVTGSTFDASGVAAGTYVVTYTFTNSNSCSASATANVTVNALPTVTADNKSVCTGNTVALTGSPAGGTWSGDHVTGSTFDASGVAAGTYVVTYTFTNSNSCSASATANVTVNALPTVTADNKSVCTGNTVALTGSPAGGTWSGDHVTGSTFDASGVAAGTYVVTYTFTNSNSCSASATANVTVNALPTVTADAKEVCTGATVALTGSPAGGTWSGDHVTGSTFDASGVAAGTYVVTYTFTNSNSCSASATANVTVNVCGGPLCTYTQGYYGNTNGNSCDADGTGSGAITYGNPVALITAELNNGGTLTVGKPLRSVYLPVPTAATTAARVNSVMPGNGTPKELTVATDVDINSVTFTNNYLTKQGKINNVLLSQTITLGLNMRISSGLPNFTLQAGTLVTAPPDGPCGTTTAQAHSCIYSNVAPYALISDNYVYKTITADVIAALNTKGYPLTVAGLYQLASDALGNVDNTIGTEGGASLSAINAAVDAINTGFDKCRIFVGWNVTPCAPYNPALTVTTRAGISNMSVLNETSNKLSVATYPNPFNDVVKFTIQSKVSGQAQLVVYNALGQRLATVYNGFVQASRSQIVEYKAPSAAQQNLIYVLQIGSERVTGKLINIKR